MTDSINLAVLAGTASTALFVASTLPMLVKARRTRDLASYSFGNLLLANVGNLVHSVYVLSLPAGPIWALHGFYVVTTGLMGHAASRRNVALVLAAIGIFGVVSYGVSQRTREIGVRMALGANGAAVRGLVLRQVGVMLAIGGAVGIALALGLGRAARSMLYQLEGHDPLSLVMAVLLLAGIALAAGFVPARRAAMVDPMHALRYD